MALGWKIELNARDIRILSHVAAEPPDPMACGNYPGISKDSVTPSRRLVGMGLMRSCTEEETRAREIFNQANRIEWMHPGGDGRFHRLTLKGQMIVDLMRMDADSLLADLFPSLKQSAPEEEQLPPEAS